MAGLGKLLVSGAAAGGLFMLARSLFGDARAPRGTVQVSVKPPRRSLRDVWQGTAVPATLPAVGVPGVPKFKAGDRVKVVLKLDPGDIVPPEQGQVATIKALAASEVVNLGPNGAMTPAGLPLRWSYVLDATVGDPPQPLRVDELSLVKV